VTSLIKAAMEIGLPVFPCRNRPGTPGDKVPLTPREFKDASGNPETIQTLFAQHRGCLIGVPTGEASGIGVLDVDPRNGGLEWLAANKNRLPATRIHQTRSGGAHLLFRHHTGLRNSAGKIAPGIDTRGDGGYVIWWPAHGLSFEDFPRSGVPEWPQWLLEAMATEPAPRRADITPIGDWQKRPAHENVRDLNAFFGLLRFVADSPLGERNSRLYWAACRMDEFFAKGLVSSCLGFDALEKAAAACGLSRREISSTIASALRRAG
jgi:Bifunctional DNA primase/polymerase, N-terminal